MKNKTRVLSAFLTAVMMFSAFMAAFAWPAENVQAADAYSAKITVLDFGSTGMAGDAVLIESKGHYILMDTGYTDSPSNHSNSSVIKYLKNHGIKNLDLYLSHYHNDHYYLLTTIMNDSYFKIGTFYLPENKNLLKYSDPKYKDKAWYNYFTKNITAHGTSWEKHSYSEIKQVIADRKINAKYITKGAKFTVGDAQFEVLWHNQSRSPAGNYKTAATGFLNNESLCTRMTCDGVRYLTCGDIESAVENELVNKGIDIKADIVKANHHGDSDSSNTKAFFGKVRPTYLFGTGYYTSSIKQRAKDFNINIACMKNNGVLTYTIKDGGIEFNCTKSRASESKAIKLADGTKQTRTFYFASGYAKHYTSKMIPKGASYLSGNFGWKTVKGKKYYYDEDGVMVKGRFYSVAGKLYYFNAKDGHMEVRWTSPADGGKCYCGNDGVVQMGWRTIDKKNYYFNPENNGKMALGKFQQVGKENVWFFSNASSGVQIKNAWCSDSNGKYFARANGELAKGWQTIGGKVYYFHDDCHMQPNGTLTLDGIDYIFGTDGVFQCAAFDSADKVPETFIGIALIDGDTYYYKNGAVQSGWQTVNGNKYYFGTDNKAVKGLASVNGKKYFFNESTGVMGANGWVKNENGDWLYADKNGVLQTGWKTISGKKYYIDPATCIMAKGRTVVSGKVYFMNASSGALVKNAWGTDVNGDRYHTDKNGVCYSGWKTISKKKYYFDPSTKVAAKGFTMIGSKEYYFNAKDNRMEVRWTSPADGGKVYCGNDGVIWKGWKDVSKKHYYFNPDDHGRMAVGPFQQSGKTNVWFFADKNGVQIKNAWCTDASGNKYFARANGELMSGWQTISGKTYYFHPDQKCKVQTGLFQVKDKVDGWYFADKNGVQIKNAWCVDASGNKHYAGANGELLKGIHEIDGKKYEFGSDSVLIREIEEPAPVSEPVQEPVTEPAPETPAEAPTQEPAESIEEQIPEETVPEKDSAETAVEIPSEEVTE